MQYKTPFSIVAVCYLLLFYTTTLSAQLTPTQVTNLPAGYYLNFDFSLNENDLTDYLTEYDSMYYFVANDQNHPLEAGTLYQYDGTSTPIITNNINTSSDSINNIIGTFQSKLLFNTVDSNYSLELYAYDGTSTQKLGLKDVYVAKEINNQLILNGTGSNGRGMYSYDGSNLSFIDSINFHRPFQQNIYTEVVEDTMFFVGYYDATGSNNNRLYKYDGISLELIDSTTLNDVRKNNFAHLTYYKGDLYFTASFIPVSYLYLCKYDGVSYDTVSINNTGVNPTGITVEDGNMYFSGLANINFPSTPHVLFEYDGTNFNILTGAEPSATTSGDEWITKYNGDLIYRSLDTTNGIELSKWNGTTNNLIADINPNGNSSPGEFFIYNNTLIFNANDGSTYGSEIWQYDGTTVSIFADVNPNGDSYAGSFRIINNELYFVARINGASNIYKLSNNTSITELASQQDLQVFPNPTTGQITLQTSTKIETVQLLNLEGKVVLTPSVDNINISSLAAGIYILHAKTNEGSMYQKVVKKQLHFLLQRYLKMVLELDDTQEPFFIPIDEV